MEPIDPGNFDPDQYGQGLALTLDDMQTVTAAVCAQAVTLANTCAGTCDDPKHHHRPNPALAADCLRLKTLAETLLDALNQSPGARPPGWAEPVTPDQAAQGWQTITWPEPTLTIPDGLNPDGTPWSAPTKRRRFRRH